jgi:hypothetical protein
VVGGAVVVVVIGALVVVGGAVVVVGPAVVGGVSVVGTGTVPRRYGHAHEPVVA